jgi:galactonate dehydratase
MSRKTSRLRQWLVPRPPHPGKLQRQGKAVIKRGYTALKFDPFGDNWRTLSPPEFDLSLEIICAVREAVGEEVDVLIEGHRRFNLSTALQFAHAMHRFRPAWFEEPLDHSNISAMAELARRSPVPIATGESFSNEHQFAELLKHDVIDIWQPEPLNLGGLFATRKVPDFVDAHYGVVAPHSAQGPVCSAPARSYLPPFPTSSSRKSSTILMSPGRNCWSIILFKWSTALSRFPTGPALE